ncbi:MAG: hypothetical protein U9R79_09590, partial [Armatimonadota bacterium]|nr:hypothetical protein [Armatimonadota bacterium]
MGEAVATSVAMFRLGRWDEALELAEQMTEDDPAQPAVRGICGTLTRLPLELGTRCPAAPEDLDGIEAELGRARAAGWSEVEACFGWVRLLRSSATPSPEDLPQLAALADAAGKSAWTPIRGLAGRALAFYDMRRQAVGRLSDAAGAAEGDLAMLEARLEAGRLGEFRAGDVPEPTPPLPAWLHHEWRLLLQAEVLTQDERALDAAERTLGLLVERWRREPEPAESDGYAQAERRRLRARGLVARARLALARNRPDLAAEHLDAEGAEHLPEWERVYLRALADWQAGDLDAAHDGLRGSLRANPMQRRVRQELGSLIAGRRPQEALEHIDAGPHSPGLVGARAAALLALGRDREAAEALERLEDPPLVCFPRLSWPDGQRARVRQAW